MIKEPTDAKLGIAKEIKTPAALLMGVSVRGEVKKEKRKGKKKKSLRLMPFPQEVTFFSVGSDEKLNLNLPYDVDKYFYLFFVADYIGVKIMLEQAGLEEDGHYMDGTMLIEEELGAGGVINPTKAFELM